MWKNEWMKGRMKEGGMNSERRSPRERGNGLKKMEKKGREKRRRRMEKDRPTKMKLDV